MRISKTFHFEAAHHLTNVPDSHQCARVHGHSYVVDVEVSGQVDRRMGWVMDFADISAAWNQCGKPLDHRDLNDILENPTAENLAAMLFTDLEDILGSPLVAVTVHETATSWARVDA
jgi:6-pyruvoyltetrahydropterin/6-carboxytetrahydropterin synthase